MVVDSSNIDKLIEEFQLGSNDLKSIDVSELLALMPELRKYGVDDI